MPATCTGKQRGIILFKKTYIKIHDYFQERSWQVGFEHKMGSQSVGMLAGGYLNPVFGKGD